MYWEKLMNSFVTEKIDLLTYFFHFFILCSIFFVKEGIRIFFPCIVNDAFCVLFPQKGSIHMLKSLFGRSAITFIFILRKFGLSYDKKIIKKIHVINDSNSQTYAKF